MPYGKVKEKVFLKPGKFFFCGKLSKILKAQNATKVRIVGAEI